MPEMSVSRQADVWADHKERTREALLKAALELLRQGATPTVVQAAEHAGVSRATAYRYFPTQEALLFDLTKVIPATTPVDEFVASLASVDVEERLLQLVDVFNRVTITEETQWRMGLRVMQDTWLEARRRGENAPVVREGRRMQWLDTVLEPAEGLSNEQRRRLQCALGLTLGIDSVAIMKDVCRLDDEETMAVLRWAATALLRAALEEAKTSR
jgi:AcrR family transcriptional regulator